MSFLLDPPSLFVIGIVLYFLGNKIGLKRPAKIIIALLVVLTFILFSILLYADVFRCVFPVLCNNLSSSQFMFHSNITGIYKENVPLLVVIVMFILYPLWIYLGYTSAVMLMKRKKRSRYSNEIKFRNDVESKKKPKSESKYYVVRYPDCKNHVTDKKQAVRYAIDELGGIKKFVNKGEKVLIKVNICGGVPNEPATYTSHDVTSAVLEMVRRAGGESIICDADMVWTNFWTTAKAQGWLEWAQKKNVEITTPSYSKKSWANVRLFNWEDIPKDNEKLISFLDKHYGIEWTKESTIEKIEPNTIKVTIKKIQNDKTINVHNITLRLNDKKTEANLEIDDIVTDNFSVLDGKSIIYKDRKDKLVNLSDTEIVNFHFGKDNSGKDFLGENNGQDRVSKNVVEADVIISVAAMKTHNMTDVTLGMKNMYGTLPEIDKAKYHRIGINEVICAINKNFTPNLTIIDGSIGGESIGPMSCEPVDFHTIIASNDVVTADIIAAQLMGFENPMDIMHIKLAYDNEVGDAPQKFEMDSLPYKHDKDSKWNIPASGVGDFYTGMTYQLLKVPTMETHFNMLSDFAYDASNLPILKYINHAVLQCMNDISKWLLNKKKMYLFNWDEIPGDDDWTLMKYLKKKYDLGWVERAKIAKKDNNKTIELYYRKNYLSMELVDDESKVDELKVNLKIDDGRSDEMTVKKENDTLKIFEKPDDNKGKVGVKSFHCKDEELNAERENELLKVDTKIKNNKVQKDLNLTIFSIVSVFALVGFVIGGYLAKSSFGLILGFGFVFVVAGLLSSMMKTKHLIVFLLASGLVSFFVERYGVLSGMWKYIDGGAPPLFSPFSTPFFFIVLIGFASMLKAVFSYVKLSGKIKNIHLIPIILMLVSMVVFMQFEGYLSIISPQMIIIYLVMAIIGLYYNNRQGLEWNLAFLIVAVTMGGIMEMTGILSGVWKFAFGEGLPVFISFAWALNAWAACGIAEFLGKNMQDAFE